MVKPLRIATWNIGGGFVSTHQPLCFDVQDLSHFVEVLQPLACDVICLQEVHTPIAPDGPRQAEELANGLGMPYWTAVPCDTIQPSHLASDQFLSLAILSRWKIEQSSYTLLPNPRLHAQAPTGATWLSHDKGLLRAHIQWPGNEITVFSVHALPFHLFGRDIMEDAFRPIRGVMEGTILASRPPTIVAGDWNYESVERMLPIVFQTGYTHAPEGVATEPARGRLLDHVLASSHWRITSSAVLSTRADHYLCCADLDLKIPSRDETKP